MKKRLLILLAASFAVILGATAQTNVAGVYNGDLKVVVLGTPIEMPDQSIEMVATGTDVYSFVLENFVFGEGESAVNVGDIEFDDVAAVEEGGVVTLTRTGFVEKKIDSPLLGGEKDVQISLTSGKVENGVLTLDLSIAMLMDVEGSAVPMSLAAVSFEGNIAINIEKRYSGVLTASALGVSQAFANAKANLSKEEGLDTYKLLFSGFNISISGAPESDISLDGITVTEADGTFILSKDASMIMLGGMIPATVSSFSGSIEGDKLNLEFAISTMGATVTVIFAPESDLVVESTFLGTLNVSRNGVASAPKETSIDLLSREGEDTYALRFTDFALPISSEGNAEVFNFDKISLDGVTLTDAGDGTYTLSREDTDVTLITGAKVSISLVSGTIDGEELKLELLILDGNVKIKVLFNIDETGIFQTAAEKASQIQIYPSVATDNIQVIGATEGIYTIYSVNGVTAKTGSLSQFGIDVSALANGTYILSIDGQTARFVKK